MHIFLSLRHWFFDISSFFSKFSSTAINQSWWLQIDSHYLLATGSRITPPSSICGYAMRVVENGWNVSWSMGSSCEKPRCLSLYFRWKPDSSRKTKKSLDSKALLSPELNHSEIIRIYLLPHNYPPLLFCWGVGGWGGGGGCKRGLFSELYGYLVCGLVLFLIVLKVFPIVTNLQIVLGHPLRVIISSLGCYSCYSCPLPTNINLYPLTQITYPNHPSSRACFVIKPPKRDGMWNRIPFWRCSNLSICDHSIWHAESVLATS